jgi:hypothetical protein
MDTNTIIAADDSPLQLLIEDHSSSLPATDREQIFSSLKSSWPASERRHEFSDECWIADLDLYLEDLAQRRIEAVEAWIRTNTARFSDNTASIDPLNREFRRLANTMKASLQLCKMKCSSCYLFCTRPRHHEGNHNCLTAHHCPNSCQYEHSETLGCGLP